MHVPLEEPSWACAFSRNPHERWPGQGGVSLSVDGQKQAVLGKSEA